jgi:ABC-type multidrug transport system fused ATPase/permease subunit
MDYRLNRRFVPWLIAHGLEFWHYYLGALTSLYCLHHFQSIIPGLAKELGDLVAAGKISEVNISNFFLLAIAVLVFRTLSRLLFFYPARVQQKYLRMELMFRLESSHPAQYDSFNDGQIFQTIFNDINRIRGLVGFGLLQVGNIIIAATIFIPKIRDFNPDFLIAFSPLLGGMIFFTIMIAFFQPLMKKEMDLMGEVQNFIIESYDAKKTIKNFHSENAFFKLFQKHSAEEQRIFFLSGIGKTLGIPLVRACVGISLIWAAYIVKDQSLGGTALIFFSGFLFLILEPLMFLSWIGVVVSQGYAGWSRIKELVREVEDERQSDWEKQEKLFSPQLPFWKQQVDLEIQPQKWNVLVGETGCGKSFLMEKLADVFHASDKSYSFIHQEPYLYNDTIENNIFLGNERTEHKRALALKYLKCFGLDVLGTNAEAVMKLEVGENGKMLSGGQAKRVALIRSLVSEVDVIIWDDPFSSVDFILEKQILNVLQEDEILKDKTFVLTSHRLSTVKYCDWIIMLDKEKGIIEKGWISELFQRESISSEYFKKQLV